MFTCKCQKYGSVPEPAKCFACEVCGYGLGDEDKKPVKPSPHDFVDDVCVYCKKTAEELGIG